MVRNQMWRGLNKNGKPLLHTGWKLQAVFRFCGSTPLSSDVPATPTSDKQVSDTQPVVPHISSHNGNVFEPIQSLSANDKNSDGETIVVTDSSSPTSSFLESHPECPLLEISANFSMACHGGCTLSYQ